METMKSLYVQTIQETDVQAMIESCGGRIAHPDADQREKRGADFILGDAAIELKCLDEDGLQKRTRQEKLASLFRSEGYTAPVVVLDREQLSEKGQRTYDRALEGPIKNAVASARKQLKQTRSERPELKRSVLWIINNGYTALNHQELLEHASRRVSNDSDQIDGVIISGLYYHSDTFDSLLLWPFDYLPIWTAESRELDRLRGEWNGFAERFMTRMLLGETGQGPSKGPVVDTQFEVDETTYVRPAPPLGGESQFFKHGRPRQNSTGLTLCPKVALTFPGLSEADWEQFMEAAPWEFVFTATYADWLRYEKEAQDSGRPECPFVRVPIDFEQWQTWQSSGSNEGHEKSVTEFANDLFQQAVQKRIANARERSKATLLPARYILAVTDQIGQDKANDLSHILDVRPQPSGHRQSRQLLKTFASSMNMQSLWPAPMLSHGV